MFRRNSKRYDLTNGRLSDNAALIASINGPSFGGCASIIDPHGEFTERGAAHRGD
jgi:hypothetical protein